MNLSDLKDLYPYRILDLGTNTGEWAKEAQTVWPNAEIFCIEGNTACEPALIESGFEYRIALLGDCVRKVQFHKAKYSATATGNSYLKENTPFFDDADVEERELVPIGLIFGSDDTFNLIKIDCQGAELDIIRGGIDLFKRAKTIIMEVAVSNYNEGAPQWQEVIDFMAELGFNKTQILSNITHPMNPDLLIQHDVLFTKA